MNESSAKIKQQIVDKIKASTNILVTVSRDPSVDDLSAALGLTALLNKLDKHATAIFSGTIPPAISFLEPDKTFENSADSLRDFIIALDKEKADHLRYKVEGDVVKIFITPYRTTITSDDLDFSQGDFNVELVLALGVDDQEHLDDSLSAHGQILHDVTIATLSAGDESSQLGSMDWRNESASSLSEMVVALADSIKADKTLLDKQISTALLTGIVAATDRFSNPKTSAAVMSTAAQLMAAGADQQLIAAKLQESHAINALPGVSINENATSPADVIHVDHSADETVSTLPDDGSLAISHEEPVIEEPIVEEPVVEEAPVAREIELPEITLPQPTAVLPQLEEIESPELSSTLPPVVETEEVASDVTSALPDSDIEPSLGGTLNATADQAAEDSRRELEDQQNKTILSHSYLGGSDAGTATINGTGQTDDTQTVDIFSGGLAPTAEPEVGLPLPPPLPDFSTLPPPVPLSTTPTPDMGVPIDEPTVTSTLPPAPVQDKNDPSQFKIPGQ